MYTKNVWQDEVLAGDERYNILADDGTPIEEDVQIALATAVAQAGTAVNAARMNNIEDGLEAVDTLLDQVNTILTSLLTGWTAAGETWTYASATTITISGDKTGKYQVGDKIRLVQTTTKYFYIVGVSYSAPNTTLTITGGTSYTLANAAITSPFYSKVSNPQGFPGWFAYTPDAINLTNPVYNDRTGGFSINGRTVTCWGRADIASWSGQSSRISFTFPIALSTSGGTVIGTASYFRNGGSTQEGTNAATVASGGICMQNRTGADSVQWEASARVVVIWMVTYRI